MTILKTENEGYGFYGTIWTGLLSNGRKSPDATTEANLAWDFAFTKIQDLTKMSDEDVRTFLDSRYGRYLADSVCLCGCRALLDSVEVAAVLHNNYKHKGKNFIIEMTKLCK